jgi:hypothetical protein
MFSLQQNLRTRGQNRFCPDVEGRKEGGDPNNVYTRVNVKMIKKFLNVIESPSTNSVFGKHDFHEV